MTFQKTLSCSLFACVILTIIASVLGDNGPCRYDNNRCSCKLGAANQGVCWDSDPFEDGLCHKRYCRSGWTCACGNRTHVCYRDFHQVRVLKNPADAHKYQAACKSKTVALAGARDIKLGTVKFHFSKTGLLADDCTQMAWWHNGELMGAHERHNKSFDSAKIVSKYQDHAMLELHAGDLVAFRFREASYYCYKHLSEFVVNTKHLSTISQGVTTHYARQFSEDWFKPSFKLTGANTAANENSHPTKFVPLRLRRLQNNALITPGIDYWKAKSDNLDNKRTNFYFRIQFPDVV